MAMIEIRKAAREAQDPVLREKLEMASKTLKERSAKLTRRKDKVDAELRDLRTSSAGGSVRVLSKFDRA